MSTRVWCGTDEDESNQIQSENINNNPRFKRAGLNQNHETSQNDVLQ